MTDTPEFTIREIGRRDATQIFGAPIPALYADLKLSNGATLFLSRLAGEKEWIVDAHFRANGAPLWSHGFGQRVTRLRTITPEAAAKVDAAARDNGLGADIRTGAPLELA